MFSNDVDVVSQFYSQSGQKVGPRLPAIAGTGQKAIKRELGLEEDERDDHYVQMKRWIIKSTSSSLHEGRCLFVSFT